ncbi:MAG: c-type cytochrome biogenesis protein CcmI, partial [Burkholderiaceae bacterium]|nr:c-type cytochrome biogenesis protein CcmI [Burkholderiaceae bacterium]
MLFWVSVAVATLVVTAVVVWPLLCARPAAVPDARNEEQRRLAVFRDRKREIERERAAGRLSDSDAAQAQTDLLRQLASDLPGADGMAAGTAAPQRAPRLPRFAAALLLMLALPLLTIAVYRHVGTPELAVPGAFAGAARGAPDPAQIEALIAAIEARTGQQPDDGEAWAMLAEARKMQGRHAEAVQAFEQAVGRLAPDARL